MGVVEFFLDIVICIFEIEFDCWVCLENVCWYLIGCWFFVYGCLMDEFLMCVIVVDDYLVIVNGIV